MSDHSRAVDEYFTADEDDRPAQQAEQCGKPLGHEIGKTYTRPALEMPDEYSPAPPEASTPNAAAVEATGMVIDYQLYGKCFWHGDCEKEPRPSRAVMKVVNHEPEYSVIECLNCGRQGKYPVGGVGEMCVEEIITTTAATQPHTEVRETVDREARKPVGHQLKTHPPYFAAVESGDKQFEIRVNDRDYRVGDSLLLCEYEPDAKRFTGNTLERKITYIAQGVFGLPADVCVLSLAADLEAGTRADKVREADTSLCGCGRPTRYILNKDGKGFIHACNKYFRCLTYEELVEARRKETTESRATITELEQTVDGLVKRLAALSEDKQTAEEK